MKEGWEIENRAMNNAIALYGMRNGIFSDLIARFMEKFCIRTTFNEYSPLMRVIKILRKIMETISSLVLNYTHNIRYSLNFLYLLLITMRKIVLKLSINI